jgi:DHA1 family tetracycline resistance protein-like MFS transporter
VTDSKSSGRQSPLIWLVFFVIVIDLIGFGIVIPLLPFMAPSMGGDSTDVALIMITYSLGAAIVAPFWGRLSDQWGRRNALMLALLASALAYWVTAGAEVLWQVYLGRALSGLAAGSLPVASALMADLSTPERRAKAMGLVGTAFGLGLIAGPVLGGVLTGGASPFALPFYSAAVLSLLAAILAWALLPNRFYVADTAVKEMGTGSFVDHVQRHWLLLSQYIVHTAAVSALIYIFPLWVGNTYAWGPKAVGYFFGAVGAVMILFQGGLLSWLARRLGLLTVLRAGAALFALSIGFVALSADYRWMPAIILVAFTGSTVCLPLLNTIASELVNTSQRGRMMGATTTSASIGRILGPLVAAVLLSEIDYSAAWLGCAVLVAVLVLWSFTAANHYSTMNFR